MKNYYKILEISQDASIEVIHAAYKAMSKKNHPDLCEGDKVQASVKMQEINEAYEILSDVNLRREYDKELNLYIKQRRVKVVSASNEENTSNHATTSTNTNADVGTSANSKAYTSYNAQNFSSNPAPTSTPNSQNQEPVDKKKLATGCGCWIVIIIIAVAVIIFLNRDSIFGKNGSTFSSNASVSDTASTDDPTKSSIKYTISMYINAARSQSAGTISQDEFKDVQSKYTTENYVEASIGNFKTKEDWANDLISILNISDGGAGKAQAFIEFSAYVLPELLNDSALDINYNITEIKVDGDKATASVNLKGPDFSLLLIATANEVKKQSEKSDNLGIIPDYSELFKKCIKSVRPEYLDTVNKNCEFGLIKEDDKWKIDFVEDRKSFMEVIYLNLITFE